MKKQVNLIVNGDEYSVYCRPEATLLELIREELELTGTKEGCGAGECGACTVIMNGQPVNACLVMGLEAEGAVIDTIEGESKNGVLSDLQQAFLDHHAIQCGFCTPGMIMSARALLDATPNPSKEEIIDGLAGNYCRCTGYKQIIEAVEAVAGGEKND